MNPHQDITRNRSLTVAVSAALCVAASLLVSLADAADPPAAPPPGSPGLFVGAAPLAAALDAAKAKSTDLALASVGVTNQYSIHEVYRGKSAPPAVHPGWTELHFILEGSATFVTGGTNKGSGPGAIIEGGVSQKIAKGDAVIVPANTPHWYQTVDGSVTYLEVRFRAPSP